MKFTAKERTCMSQSLEGNVWQGGSAYDFLYHTVLDGFNDRDFGADFTVKETIDFMCKLVDISETESAKLLSVFCG